MREHRRWWEPMARLAKEHEAAEQIGLEVATFLCVASAVCDV
jgi:hypothetical protein